MLWSSLPQLFLCPHLKVPQPGCRESPALPHSPQHTQIPTTRCYLVAKLSRDHLPALLVLLETLSFCEIGVSCQELLHPQSHLSSPRSVTEQGRGTEAQLFGLRQDRQCGRKVFAPKSPLGWPRLCQARVTVGLPPRPTLPGTCLSQVLILLSHLPS